MTLPPFDNSYAQLPDKFFTRIHPEKPHTPSLIKINSDLADLLGLNKDWLSSGDGLAMLSGQKLPQTADPIAMAYAGHQFGGWSPQLGDGRAILIGEIMAQDKTRYDIQLKGSGQTPFSRQGDGKSALGPVLREYIVSEAMAALGVPTTRALATVTTGDIVFRDYPQPAAILTRVAQSHIRIGTFQYFYARADHDAVKILADYVINRHFPAAIKEDNPYEHMLKSIIKRQAKLIAKWMSLGFIHGVMNTDNMQIVGETIDYGPCAFMDAFHPAKVFSSIDDYGRYAWGNQPVIAQWNLTRLAETLLSLLHSEPNRAKEIAEEAINDFNDIFTAEYSTIFSRKLGLLDDREDQNDLISETLDVLADNEVDFTLFFRQLTKVAAGEPTDILRGLFNDPMACDNWLILWHNTLSRDEDHQKRRLKVMQQTNPIFIPRNHRVEQVIQAALQGDFSPFHRLVDILTRPFDEQPDNAKFENNPQPHEIVHQTFCGT